MTAEEAQHDAAHEVRVETGARNQGSVVSTNSTFGPLDVLFEEATEAMEALGLEDEDTPRTDAEQPHFAAGRGRVLPSSGRLRIFDDEKESESDIELEDLFATGRDSGSEGGQRAHSAKAKGEDALLSFDEHLSVSAWSYDANEARQDNQIFGNSFMRNFQDRKIRFAMPASTAQGADQRVNFLLRSKKSWLSLFQVDLRHRDPPALELVQLDRAYGHPTNKRNLIGMARVILTHLGFRFNHAVSLADVVSLPLMEMIQVYHTFMKYVKILVRLQLQEYEPEIRFVNEDQDEPMPTARGDPFRQARVHRQGPAFQETSFREGTARQERFITEDRIVGRDRARSSRGTTVKSKAKAKFKPSRRVRLAATTDEDEDSLDEDSDDDAMKLLQFIPVDNIPTFSGQEDQPEVAKKWLEKFVYLVSSANWSNKKVCRAFAIAMKDSANFWYQQLPRSAKNKWTTLRKAFTETFCSVVLQTAQSRYYNARRTDRETPTQCMRRLNNYARRAGIDFDVGGTHAEAHVMQFLTTLGDQVLADKLLGLPDIEDVNRRMQRQRIMENNIARSGFNGLRQDLNPIRQDASHQRRYRQESFREGRPRQEAPYRQGVPFRQEGSFRQEANSRRFGSGPNAGGRNSGRTPVNNDNARRSGGANAHPTAAVARSFSPLRGTLHEDTGEAYAEDEWGFEEEEFDHEVVDDAGYGYDEDDKAPRAAPAEMAIPRQGQFNRYESILPICKQCNRGRHREADCFLNRTCSLCKRRGHEAERCLYTCKVCFLVHPAGECGFRKYMDALAEWVATKHGDDELPKEIRDMKARLNL